MTTLTQVVNNTIKETFSTVNFTKESFERIEYLLTNPPESVNFKEFIDSLLKITIKEGFVIPSHYETDFLGRKAQLITLIKESIEYAHNKGKVIPDVTFYIGTKDSHNYLEPELPIFVLSKPIDARGLLFPDNSFVNWKEERKDILSKCKKTEKENIVYFRGANTGNKKHNLRKILSKDHKFKIPMKIDITKLKIPQYNFCKYKYLLNLPGTSGWSYRFKYLFLMKSLVINVALQYIRSEKRVLTKQDKWMQFFDSYFIPNQDYIEVRYVWGPMMSEKENRNNYIKLRNDIIKLYNYYEKNSNLYEKIVESGYNKVKEITPSVVHQSIYKIIKNYSKEVNKNI
jgi:hypothetical protein